MQRIIQLLSLSGTVILLADADIAIAADSVAAISSLPDKGQVTVTGTVDKMVNLREFTIRDNSGTIDVRLSENASAVIKPGDSVTVSGAMEKPLWGLLGRDINATNVEVNKNLRTTLSDALTQTTGISLGKAKLAQINQLPDQGMVKVNGTVDQISDPKNFVLKDDTGLINVSVQSADNVVVAKGTEVTVTGYVSKDALGRRLSASHVILASNE